jgi:hypothetical protein
MLTRKIRVSVVGPLLFSRFTAFLSPFSVVSFCNTEVSEFFDMENSEQLFVARAPKNVTELLLLYNKVQISSLLLSQFVCHSGKGNCPVKHRNATFSVLNPL